MDLQETNVDDNYQGVNIFQRSQFFFEENFVLEIFENWNLIPGIYDAP